MFEQQQIPRGVLREHSANLRSSGRDDLEGAGGAPLRDRARRGARVSTAPQRHSRAVGAVIQTQIVLAVVGACVMLIVGASLARAFGIVGAANLIRYRRRSTIPRTRSSCSRR
jgi:hypothetical protein